MRLISYIKDAQPGVGVMVDDTQFAALASAAPDLPDNLRDILALPDGLENIRKLVAGRSGDLSINDVECQPLIPESNAFWALALNFKTHIEETGLTTSKENPHIFMRHAKAQVGHGQPILAPPTEIGSAFDYEGELAVVIGRPGRHIPVDRAFDHIAGYTCCNEGSVRNYQEHNRQFGLGKNFEASGSLGPWLMTADELGDPSVQEVITRVNGVVRQRAPLDDMLFNVQQVIHYLSQGYTLQPGDIIAMGTPGALPPAPDDTLGIDLTQQYGRFKIPGLVHMRPGDTVEVEVTGLGVLSNPIIADQPLEYRAL